MQEVFFMSMEFQPANPAANYMAISQAVPADFSELSYAEMVTHLRAFYHNLQMVLTAPGYISFDELSQLRRRVISPEITNPNFNRYQIQLRLATEMLRLGRRQEAYGIMNAVQDKLLLWERPLRSTCYLVWTALLLAATGKTDEAFEVVLEVSANSLESHLDGGLVNFFQGLARQQTLKVS
jgi:hypothetical protein